MTPEASTEPEPPRFFLREAAHVEPARLEPEECSHALDVLRLAPGDRLVGLDGRGGSRLLRIAGAAGETRPPRRRSGGREPVLEALGPPRFDPAPGEPGAPLPHLTVAVAWPKGNRAEAMLDRLVQLGVARIVPLECRRTGPGERLRPERLGRVLRAGAKQSRRTWLPELWAPTRPAELAERLEEGAAPVRLEPGAALGLTQWALALAAQVPGRSTPARPWLIVGPEGGFDGDERRILEGLGAPGVHLGPHVLRIETAAEAGSALLAAILFAGGERGGPQRDGADAPPGVGP